MPSVPDAVWSGALIAGSGESLIVYEPDGLRVVGMNSVALRLAGQGVWPDGGRGRGLTLGALLGGLGPDGLARLEDVGRSGGVYRPWGSVDLLRPGGGRVPVGLTASRARAGRGPLGLAAARAGGPAEPPDPFFDLCAEPCCVAGLDGYVLKVNPAWVSCLGYAADELVGRPARRLIHPEDLGRVRRATRAGADRFEARFLHRDGGERRLRVRVAFTGGLYHAVACDASGQPPHADTVFDAAGRAKVEFLANISHEVRTPMTAILGFTEMLIGRARTPAPPPASPPDAPGPGEDLDHLRAVKRNGEQLLALLDDVLELSRIESSGAQSPSASDCSPAQVAAEVAAAFRARAEARGLALAVEVAPGSDDPGTVRTDPGRLREVLTRLVDNAVKFTERGGVRVCLRRGGGRLQVEVADTGVGLAPGEGARLFQPFYRGAASRRRPQGGAGLGLAISRRLTEQLGGTIEARGEPGVGSVFTVTLPAGDAGGPEPPDPPTPCPPPNDADAEAPAAPEPAGRTALDARLLVAEDNRDNQRVVSLLLGMAGADVTIAPNGLDAVETAVAARDAGRPFDLVLMDMQMPVLDGYEATRQLRALGFATPVVALTAHAMPEDRLECLRFGCDEYVSKPVDWGSLIALIARLVERSRAAAGPADDR